jgi:hypothetical protein
VVNSQSPFVLQPIKPIQPIEPIQPIKRFIRCQSSLVNPNGLDI